ncbi:motility associated factor glycosyltransferase family protein [Pseudoalteromonas ruthenica]|uniref:motility associated factor glycosyltransferase family protein n=1 Tax=Pseudoalteromonas ruthenica TaxID=151081 RepID=UPI0005FA2D60|nr:6-hydroxymethylpterin diphosphokinase MptE-like protein [Pseudoalteromonas ruthenica]TMO86759.1 DUF115 domain-containing protein [Pseudoalteromonas ruthenica]TMO93378.1 DUF115 domain-containing protein [Pseudoalteromonas ruthenica]TMP00130.1 DUF115 domain-containing protein [Pseudoalteromonas ruthenica]TMP06000.1 DUF115 domain-containing protein [Pseudoalteromonas ruthenica]TMP09410.1 DUF115 domain-containing protein [Pseudoalteromonas ruthenica]
MSPDNKQTELHKALDEAEQKLSQAQQHQRREAEFAQQANQRFDNNLTAFRKYYPNIAQFIETYQTREDFCLHVTTSGHGNFFPKDSSVPLYGDDPLEQTREQLKRYTEKANFGQADYLARKSWEAGDDRLHLQYMQRLSQVLHDVYQKDYKKIVALPEHYPTALIFGIGLGYHIPELLENHSFDYMFICEPDPELFFASLFCIEWDKVIEKIDDSDGCLFINIGLDYQAFFEDVFRLAGEIGAFSTSMSFCYQHYPSEKINQLIKTFFENYYQLHQGFGFYNDAITGLAHCVHNIEQGAQCFFAQPRKANELHDVPVFVVGNGPSLDESLDYLRDNQHKAIILAAGTAYQSLLKAGITPDFHVLVERPRITYDIQKTIEPEQGYHDANLLTVDVMYPDVLGLYKWAGMALKGPESATAFLAMKSLLKYGRQVSELPACGPFVSNTAFSYACLLGFRDIYLFGVDNGYSLSGKTHSSLSIYNDDKHKSCFKVLDGAKIRFDGNLQHDVMATPLMAMSKASFERLIMQLGNHIKIYNVGEGAKLEGAMAVEEQSLVPLSVPLDKSALVEGIKSNYFEALEFDDIEQSMGFDELASLCDYLIEIGQRPYATRDEAQAILKAQQRVVFAYKASKYRHLFHLIKGTLLYFHCPMVSLLYYFEDEAATLQEFQRCLDLWHQFLADIKDDFPVNWKAKCTWTKPQYQQYKEAK